MTEPPTTETPAPKPKYGRVQKLGVAMWAAPLGLTFLLLVVMPTAAMPSAVDAASTKALSDLLTAQLKLWIEFVVPFTEVCLIALVTGSALVKGATAVAKARAKS